MGSVEKTALKKKSPFFSFVLWLLLTLHSHSHAALRLAASSAFCLSVAAVYKYVPKIATPDPTQLRGETGLRKKATADTTTATLFIVLATLNVTGVMPWSSTM